VNSSQARANSAFIRATWKLARLYQSGKCLEEEGTRGASEIEKITLREAKTKADYANQTNSLKEKILEILKD